MLSTGTNSSRAHHSLYPVRRRILMTGLRTTKLKRMKIPQRIAVASGILAPLGSRMPSNGQCRRRWFKVGEEPPAAFWWQYLTRLSHGIRRPALLFTSGPVLWRSIRAPRLQWFGSARGPARPRARRRHPGHSLWHLDRRGDRRRLSRRPPAGTRGLGPRTHEDALEPFVRFRLRQWRHHRRPAHPADFPPLADREHHRQPAEALRLRRHRPQ